MDSRKHNWRKNRLVKNRQVIAVGINCGDVPRYIYRGIVYRVYGLWDTCSLTLYLSNNVNVMCGRGEITTCSHLAP